MSSTRGQRKRSLDTVSSDRAAGDPATRQRICEAALRLITKRGGMDVTLAEVARAARVSRQALYLHFADRAGLLLALVRYQDERQGVPEGIQRIQDATSGTAALREMAAMQARINPAVWPLARLAESVRRQDVAAEQAWQDRLTNRLRGCQTIVARLAQEGALRADVEPDEAADLLWTLTSLRTWEDLVLLRAWTADQYEQRLARLLLTALVRTDDAPPS
jgi:AcrR family transcriptional regulator